MSCAPDFVSEEELQSYHIAVKWPVDKEGNEEGKWRCKEVTSEEGEMPAQEEEEEEEEMREQGDNQLLRPGEEEEEETACQYWNLYSTEDVELWDIKWLNKDDCRSL